MAFAKETGPPAYIAFYYQKTPVFENISLRTMYRARNLKDDKGESQIDDYAMSADELDAFEIFIKQAIYDAFDIVMKMTTSLTDPVFIDETITIAAAPVTNAYGFNIFDEEAYNENNLYTTDDGIRKYIDAHIMTNWYDLVGHNDEYTKWLARRDDARMELITRKLFQLRKPLLS